MARNLPKIDMAKVQANAQAAKNATHMAAPVVSELSRRVNNMTGDTLEAPICGRMVTFKLKTIPASQVERRTMVWGENERLQELLTETALEDLIPSFMSSGQRLPAFGREINGIIEIADGSRRRKTALLTKSDYRVLVGDLDDEQMADLSQVGNVYRKPSAYERGRRYARLLESKFDGNVSKLAEAEKVDRKIINRCLNTARLPIEVIKIFDNPSDLSARAGDELHTVYQKHTEDFMARVADFQIFRDCGERNDTDMILKTLKASGATAAEKQEKAKPRVRKFGDGVTAKYDGDNVNISLRAVSPEVLRRIEAVLEAASNPGSNKDVNEMFEALERKIKGK